jgi:phosphatidylglycerophosphate synthase
MLARWLRTWDGRFLKPLLMLLAQRGIAPNMVTTASFLMALLCGLVLSQGHLALGAAILLLSGLLDALDGELARFLKIESALGGFLDSVADHCGDCAIYLGLLWFCLSRSTLSDAILIFMASFGSLFGGHVRSRASMTGIDTKDIGIFTRCERLLVLAAGLFTSRVTEALWVLAVLNNFSAAQRLIYVLHAAHPGHSRSVPDKAG